MTGDNCFPAFAVPSMTERLPRVGRNVRKAMGIVRPHQGAKRRLSSSPIRMDPKHLTSKSCRDLDDASRSSNLNQIRFKVTNGQNILLRVKREGLRIGRARYRRRRVGPRRGLDRARQDIRRKHGFRCPGRGGRRC